MNGVIEKQNLLSPKERTRVFASFVLDVLLIVLAGIGVWIDLSKYGVSCFQYYTMDSNVFLLLACALRAWFEAGILWGKRLNVPDWVRVLRYTAVCTVALTFVVVVAVLAPLSGGVGELPRLLFQGANLYHHLLCPLLAVLGFAILEGTALSDRRLACWALLPTVCYALVAVVLNLLGVMDGPYPFLRVRILTPVQCVLYFSGILLLAWLLARLVQQSALWYAAARERKEGAAT